MPAWDAAGHGPLLALDPNTVRRAAKAPDGSAFSPYRPTITARDLAPRYGRILMRAGSVSVLAPPTMTVFEENPGTPNLFEGMRRPDKVKYLMASLSEAQWKTMGGPRGIGLSDLTGEQRLVFLSLLPDPFRVRRYTVNGKGGYGKDIATDEFAPSEREQVRLRLERSVNFLVRLQGKERGWTTFVTGYIGAPNSETISLDDKADFDRPDSYGVQIKHEVPNKPRKGDLNLEAPTLRRSVLVLDAAKPETLGDLVRRAGKACGLEIHADFRIRALPLWTSGGTASAGDLLRALCLSVGGTFRKIEANGETAYVLTGDLIGMGQRKLRLATWYAEAEDAIRQRDQEMQRTIAKSGGLQNIRFLEDNPLSPSPELQRRMAEADKLRQGDPYREEAMIPVSELTPTLQALVRQEAATRNNGKHSQPFDDSRISVETRLKFTYVLPDGAPILANGWGTELGSEYFFTPERFARDAKFEANQQEEKPPQDKDAAPLPSLPQAFPSRMIALRAATPDEARRAVAGAARYGFDRVWLADPEIEILKAAIAAGKERGVMVWAAVSPLLQPEGESQGPDINLLGETASRVTARLEKSPRYLRARESGRRRSFPPGMDRGEELPPSGRDWLSPSATDRAIERVVALAAVPGLGGLVLRDLVVPGYEGKRSDGYAAGFDPTVHESVSMGYTPAMRLAFLRKAGVDPIDLTSSQLRLGADLRQPFFLDNRLRGDSSVYNGRNNPVPGFEALSAQWDNFRGEESLGLSRKLFEAVKRSAPENLAIYTPARDTQQYDGQMPFRWYEPWTRADSPPTLQRIGEDGSSFPGQEKAATERLMPMSLGDWLAEKRQAPWAHYLIRTAVRSAVQRRNAPPARATGPAPLATLLLEMDTAPLDPVLSFLETTLTPVRGSEKTATMQ